MHAQMGLYRGTGHTLSRIVREEGIGALYRGIGPSVAAIIPEAAITYGACTVRRSTGSQVPLAPLVIQNGLKRYFF